VEEIGAASSLNRRGTSLALRGRGKGGVSAKTPPRWEALLLFEMERGKGRKWRGLRLSRGGAFFLKEGTIPGGQRRETGVWFPERGKSTRKKGTARRG